MQYRHRCAAIRLAACATFLILLTGVAQAAAQFADPVADITRVVELMDRRLDLMPEVVTAKWLASQPIVDTAREKVVLDRSVATASSLGLDERAVRRLFELQIAMAREVEERQLKKLRGPEHANLTKPRDLRTQLRPELDRISRNLVVAVYLAADELAQPGNVSLLGTRLMRLQRYDIDTAHIAQLKEALTRIRRVRPLTLSEIKHAGVLRVGTTGDYAPFSIEKDRELAGFDVDLVSDFAQHLGVRLRFVRTSWPTLMDDLRSQRFDLAASGISVTPERSSDADFSTAYVADGKMAVALCTDAHRFASLEAIDQPSVRVVVNPGGTNEQFVREHLKQAIIKVHRDNRTIFEELLAGRADVMITDGIEVASQTRRNPKLCCTTSQPFTKTRKAIMVPKGSNLIPAIDAWLAPQIEDGSLAGNLQRAIAATQK